MSQSLSSGDRSRRAAGVALALCLASLACSVQEKGSIGEPIRMGPWTFRVERTHDTIESNASREQFKYVIVEIRLDNYMERHEKTFDDFLNGKRPGALIAFPKITLVDKEGTEFDAWTTPDSGGSLRSERWTVRIGLIPSGPLSMESSADLAAKYLDSDLADFRLVITNPDRRSGQPGSVSIPLK